MNNTVVMRDLESIKDLDNSGKSFKFMTLSVYLKESFGLRVRPSDDNNLVIESGNDHFGLNCSIEFMRLNISMWEESHGTVLKVEFFDEDMDYCKDVMEFVDKWDWDK